MTRSLRITLAALPLVSLVAGCDPASVDDAGSARRGMEAMLGALNLGGGQFRDGEVPDVPGLPDTSDAGDVDLSHEVDIDLSVACPGGGSMAIEGRSRIDTQTGDLDDADQAWGGTNAEFSLTVAFDGCDVEGVVMDGDLTYEQQLDVDSTVDSVRYDYHWSYQGLVELSGAAKGSCEVDMGAAFTSDGDDIDLDLGARDYSGTMCGFEAAELAADADL